MEIRVRVGNKRKNRIENYLEREEEKKQEWKNKNLMYAKKKQQLYQKSTNKINE
jgi:hypothetical protein